MSADVQPPPRRPSAGPRPGAVSALLAWGRANPLSLIGWVLIAWLAYETVPALLRWAVFDATLFAEDRRGCDPSGACWAFVLNRLPQFAFGFYPEGERWRAVLAILAPLIALALVVGPGFRRRGQIVIAVLALYPVAATLLLVGGYFGLTPVPARQWGGFLLTIYIGTTAFVLAFPTGLLLALGRTSRLPALRALATATIELWRGLPLIAVLFIAVIMLPLILPPGVELPRIALALAGLTLYVASYLAEVFRGGLQSLGKGQAEAAAAVGFGFWTAQAYIIMPQAIRVAMPGMLNTTIALFKDTTYVLVIGLFDFLNIVNAAVADPKWVGLAAEGYILVGVVFWCLCFLLASVSRSLEAGMASKGRRGGSA